jgi:LysM repeat protein
MEVEPVALPTPEPRTHIIEKGEDLGGLALKYGISLAEIMAANPEIDPRMISIGTAIIIPSAVGEESETAPQAFEAGVSIKSPHCLLNAGGGLTCFSAVLNELDSPVENISLNFILLDADQNEITSQLSYAPLNLLPGGAAMPFLANFQGPMPSSYSIRANLAGALPGADSPERYLSHSLEGATAEIAADGLSARVTGQVQLAPDQANAGTTWVLAVGYNHNGDVICLRRWEDTAGIEAGQSRSFEFTIYSSLEKIERVEFLSESRP